MKFRTDISRYIDHTYLKPFATANDIRRACEEASRYKFISVCIPPGLLAAAREALADDEVNPEGVRVLISTVVGFPLGFAATRVKLYEAMDALLSGADELDFVINIGACKDGNWGLVEKEIESFITVTPGAVRKIIIESCYLTDEEKIRVSQIALRAGADYIKTSTGFGAGGAAIEDIRLIQTVTKGHAGIKAAGGIRTAAEVLAFLDAGATRIGTSSGTAIMEQLQGLDKSEKN